MTSGRGAVALAALVVSAAAYGCPASPRTTPVPSHAPSPQAWVDSYSLQDFREPRLWEKAHPFDAQGIVQVNYGGKVGVQYNPVTIAQYALANYNKYISTGEDKYKTTFLTQVEYLRNNSDAVGEEMAGFPYRFPFGYGLEPGWYSGMAQGQVISVLARAYLLTRDETILPFIKKVNSFMLLPVSKGGTLTYTPEGNVWIEEYPSKPPSLVLNGFMFSILGLYDYLQLFPEDREVYQVYRDSLGSLKASLEHYDTGSWLRYSRWDDHLAARGYGEVHVNEMKQLFAITGDRFFDFVATKWESYLQGEQENCILGDGWYHVPSRPRNLAAWSNIADWDSTRAAPSCDVRQLFDDDPNTYFASGKYDLSDTNPHYINLKLKNEVTANSLVLTLFNRTLFPEALEILYRSNQNPSWLRLDAPGAKDPSGMRILYRFDELPIGELKLVCRKAAGQDRLVLSEIALSNDRESEVASYGVYYPDIVRIDSPYFEVRLKARGIAKDKIFVQYRYADEIEWLQTPFSNQQAKVWEFQTINPLEKNRTPTLGKYYRFKVVFKNESANSGFADFRVLPGK